MIEEIWKDVPGYEGCYQASTFGRIKSYDRTLPFPNNGPGATRKILGRILKSCPDKNGYHKLSISKNGHIKCIAVHRMVAWAFVPNTDGKKEVNHKNGIKTDNSPDNLEWATRSENQIHAFKKGLQVPLKGEMKGGSKLKNIDIPKIREMIKSGALMKDIGKIFNVNHATIGDIKNNKTWTHV